jgi:hypothetical protein
MNRPSEVRLIGGPNDGEVVPFRGGFLIEVDNPDKDRWGPTEFLAYAYEETETGELIGVFPH